jgi:putative spermidine/putrescine transport system permease protein
MVKGESVSVSTSQEARTRRTPSFFKLIPTAPFFLLFGFFFCYPIGKVIYLSLMSNESTFTFSNFATALKHPYLDGIIGSIKLGLISAGISVLPGALAAYFIQTRGGSKLKKSIAALSGVLANTGGIPLAFMFMAAIGVNGALTKVLKSAGFDLYAGHFSLGTFTGIVIVYLYFQVPLMVIVFSPAIASLRREWLEAATSLGANSFQYWIRVGIPLLFPSFLASFLLLFANGFSAYATANALTVGNVSLTPLQIAGLLNGNVSASQLNLGKALAVTMIIISALAVIPYLMIQRRVQRWKK